MIGELQIKGLPHHSDFLLRQRELTVVQLGSLQLFARFLGVGNFSWKDKELKTIQVLRILRT